MEADIFGHLSSCVCNKIKGANLKNIKEEDRIEWDFDSNSSYDLKTVGVGEHLDDVKISFSCKDFGNFKQDIKQTTKADATTVAPASVTQ